MTEIVAPLLSFRNSAAVLGDGRQQVRCLLMGKEDRRAKVTPETKAEAARLAQLWATRSHPTQAEFGELYEIGNQSAVGQFLRGDTPLSLKAAKGFASGLNCSINDFSPRLAQEASEIAKMVPAPELAPEVASLAMKANGLPKATRNRVLIMWEQAMQLAYESLAIPNGRAETEGDRDKKQKRTK